MADTYTHDLLLVIDQLKNVAETIEIRGQAAARFVFATQHQRAIELSRSSDGMWVECWHTSADGPVMDATFHTYTEAIAYARTWLQGGTESTMRLEDGTDSSSTSSE